MDIPPDQQELLEEAKTEIEKIAKEAKASGQKGRLKRMQQLLDIFNKYTVYEKKEPLCADDTAERRQKKS